MRISQILRAGALSSSLVAAGMGSALAEGAFIIVDILPIQNGKTVADARAYFDDVEPIFAKYGMTRSDAVLKVGAIMRGEVKANVINLWETDDPDAAFKGIFSDADYKTHTGVRDALFDMKAATIIVTERNAE